MALKETRVLKVGLPRDRVLEAPDDAVDDERDTRQRHDLLDRQAGVWQNRRDIRHPA